MSKLDQLKALGDAKRASRKDSDGGVKTRARVEAPEVANTEPSRVHLAEVASRPSEAKLKRGRPKVTGKRPWELEGISRRTYYRRRAEQNKGEKK